MGRPKARDVVVIRFRTVQEGPPGGCRWRGPSKLGRGTNAPGGAG